MEPFLILLVFLLAGFAGADLKWKILSKYPFVKKKKKPKERKIKLSEIMIVIPDDKED